MTMPAAPSTSCSASALFFGCLSLLASSRGRGACVVRCGAVKREAPGGRGVGRLCRLGRCTCRSGRDGSAPAVPSRQGGARVLSRLGTGKWRLSPRGAGPDLVPTRNKEAAAAVRSLPWVGLPPAGTAALRQPSRQAGLRPAAIRQGRLGRGKTDPDGVPGGLPAQGRLRCRLALGCRLTGVCSDLRDHGRDGKYGNQGG